MTSAAPSTPAPDAPVCDRRRPDVPVDLIFIDNYDSFSYNIVQYFEELGASVAVYRNDALTLAQLVAIGAAAPAPPRLVISPGPGAPRDAGLSTDAIRAIAGRLPVLGVCLGAFRPRVSRAVLQRRRAAAVAETAAASCAASCAAATAGARIPGSTIAQAPSFNCHNPRNLRPEYPSRAAPAAGHQCMFEVFGGVVEHAGEIVHGKTSDMVHDGKGLFAGGCALAPLAPPTPPCGESRCAPPPAPAAAAAAGASAAATAAPRSIAAALARTLQACPRRSRRRATTAWRRQSRRCPPASRSPAARRQAA